MNWGWGIVISLAVFFIGMGVIVGIAMMERNDLVTEDYYAKELRHEQQMERERRSAAMEERVVIVAEAGGIRVSFPRTLDRERVRGRIDLYRPSDERSDRRIPLLLDSTHAQSFPTREMERGMWRVKLSWSYGDAEYYDESKVVLE